MQDGLSVIFQAINDENIIRGHELILTDKNLYCTLLKQDFPFHRSTANRYHPFHSVGMRSRTTYPGFPSPPPPIRAAWTYTARWRCSTDARRARSQHLRIERRGCP